MQPENSLDRGTLAHPRTIGWLGTSALAMAESNQSLFLIGALIAGQDGILGQGSAVVPRSLIVTNLQHAGKVTAVVMEPGMGATKNALNGGGDRFSTDGKVALIVLTQS